MKEFNDKYVDGRVAYPWDQWLPKAGWRLKTDTLHTPRMGVSFQKDSAGLLVVLVEPGSMADAAGLKPGDVVTSIDNISTNNPAWENWRTKFSAREGSPIEIKLIHDGKAITINPPVRFATLIDRRIEPDPNASDKAKRIREGILRGTTTSR
jgi:C-terminal processing protease CtpA/Prc